MISSPQSGREQGQEITSIDSSVNGNNISY